jgi:phosphoadenosine phosphosulfate reductase
VSDPAAQTEPAATDIAGAAARLTGAAPEEILGWALSAFPRDRIALCTSLQDEGMALLDMAVRIDPQVQVFTIDTGRLPPETLELIDEVRGRYRVRVEVVYPDATEVSRLVTEHGVNLFYQSVDLRLSCCEVRKVNPLKRRLAGLDAWITGLRREHNESRGAVAAVGEDALHGSIVKVNPLAGWSAAQVAEYIEEHDVPRNSLYRQGYTSIGCAPCTRATLAGEDPRAGRWWWEQGARECGLHYELKVDADGNSAVVATSSKKAATGGEGGN